MKKIMMLAMAVVMTLSANAERMRVATHRFDKVNVNVPAHVTLAWGNCWAIDVRSEDGAAVHGIRWTVENGTLKINTTDMATMEQRNGRLQITVISPRPVQLTLGNSMEVTKNKRINR